MTIEGTIRKYAGQLQTVYDCLPFPLQWAATSARGLVLSRIRYSSSFWRSLEEIIARESWTAEQMYNYQCRCLQKIVQHAYSTTEFYRQWFDAAGVKPADICCSEDLSKLPVLTREDVQKNWRKMVSKAVAPSQRVVHRTSGTSGAGLTVVVDRTALAVIWAYIARQLIWADVEPRDWRLSLYGARVTPPTRNRPPYWSYNLPGRQILLSSFHLSEKNISHYVDILQSNEGLLLEGFATTLHILAKLMKQVNATAAMKAVYSTGEPLYPHMRTLLEERFQTKVWDAYGQTELVGHLQECEHGRLHLVPDFGALEIVDSDGNALPCGKPGTFLWTGLCNYAMPLIRYRIGDTGQWSQEPSCACGRSTPIVYPTLTRDSDYLPAPDGTLFSPRMLNQLLKATDFRACQFVQVSSSEVIVRYVPGKNGSTAQAQSVGVALQKWLGRGVTVRIESAAAPIQRQGGKIPLIISDLPDKDRVLSVEGVKRVATPI